MPVALVHVWLSSAFLYRNAGHAGGAQRMVPVSAVTLTDRAILQDVFALLSCAYHRSLSGLRISLQRPLSRDEKRLLLAFVEGRVLLGISGETPSLAYQTNFHSIKTTSYGAWRRLIDNKAQLGSWAAGCSLPLP